MVIITEHSAKIELPFLQKEVNKKMSIFYNPIMESQRNISILLLNSIKNENMNLALPLAGSGIRAVRFLQELRKSKINHLFVNDHKDNFVEIFTQNLKLNNLKKTRLTITNEDASLFLLTKVINKKKPAGFCGYFDYIDIDPFGSPNSFLAAAISRISREGIIAVTATDTAALTGTYPKVTRRKYWATSFRNYMMHEIGLRILIKKIQLQGVQFDKALVPILSYHKDHYFRVYFSVLKGKKRSDSLIRQHQYLLLNPRTGEYKTSPYNKEKDFHFAGPLWTGKLFDKKLVCKMEKGNPFPEEQKFLRLLKGEARKDLVGFYDLHVMAKRNKTEPPKMDLLLKKLKAVRTHFSKNGIKTKKEVKDISKLM